MAVPLERGQHTIQLVSDAVFLSESRTVNVQTAGEVALTAPALGKLEIRTSPSDAAVQFGGRDVGNAPTFVTAVAGKYPLVVRWPKGVRDLEQVLDLRPGTGVVTIAAPPELLRDEVRVEAPPESQGPGNEPTRSLVETTPATQTANVGDSRYDRGKPSEPASADGGDQRGLGVDTGKSSASAGSEGPPEDTRSESLAKLAVETAEKWKDAKRIIDGEDAVDSYLRAAEKLNAAIVAIDAFERVSGGDAETRRLRQVTSQKLRDEVVLPCVADNRGRRDDGRLTQIPCPR